MMATEPFLGLAPGDLYNEILLHLDGTHTGYRLTIADIKEAYRRKGWKLSDKRARAIYAKLHFKQV